MKQKQIIAIGGGGFGKTTAAQPTDLLLEKYFVKQICAKHGKREWFWGV